MTQLITLLVVLCILASVSAFKSAPRSRAALKPLQENFFVEMPTLNDPSKVTPELLLGEANYRKFVGEFDDNALINKLGPFAIGGEGGDYDAAQRINDLRLLTLTADSGLLEALEERGITLSQIEKLLPLVDNLGLLPLLASNKNALVGLAPLLIEPAPSLLPIIVSVLKTPPATFQAVGLGLVGVGGFEVVEGQPLLGVLALLGLPLLVLGSVLGSIGGSLPAASSYSASASVGRDIGAPSIKAGRSNVKVSTKIDGSRNGKRKVVRVNSF